MTEVLNPNSKVIYNDHHKHHLNFVVEVLKIVTYFMSYGYYDDWKLASEILTLLLHNAFNINLKFLRGPNERDAEDNEAAKAINEFLLAALAMPRLMAKAQFQLAMSTFSQEFEALYNYQTGKSRHGLPSRAKALAVLFETGMNCIYLNRLFYDC